MKIVQFMNHSHPAVMAAQITSAAMSRVYAETRERCQTLRITSKARQNALKTLALSERVHNRVSDILRNTPSAWITKEIAA